MDISLLLLVGGIGALIGLGGNYLATVFGAKKLKTSLQVKAHEELESAKTEAKKIIISAKDEATSLLADAQKEAKEYKQEVRQLEDRLIKKEDALDRRSQEVDREKGEIEKERTRVSSLEKDTKALQEKIVSEIERVAGLSREEARKKMFEELEYRHKQDLMDALTKLERDKKKQIEEKSAEIITTAIQRYARNIIADVTTSVITLPDEDMKGKIIGREGRNIRAFERLTGVELIVDETPDSIVISSFDPMRREIARMTLEKLLKDGRIQPARIEEKVEEARIEMEDRVRKIGEEAAYEVGIMDLPKEIVQLLGKLNFRTSYGQNVLNHSVEMAHIAGMIAGELGLSVEIAKKAALLHDIGKAIDHEVEGTHVEIGRKLLKKYNMNEAVVRAMESHHDEYPYASPESYIIAAADAISAARPGARRDTLEKYLRRLEEIERVVNGFDGVKQSYAVAAGREVRVFAIPEKVDDFGALRLAKDIAQKIESDVQYPGEIKITVVREVKAVEYAK